MAEPNRPAEEADDPGRPVPATASDEPAATTPYEPAAAHAVDAPETERLAPDRDARTEAVVPDRDAPTEAAVPDREARAETAAPATATAVRPHAEEPPAAPQERTVLPPAGESAPPPPRKKGNRLVATAWVLLAAGLFQVVFFAANALVALVFGGTQAVVPQVQSIAGTSLAWLPVLLFFLLFELTALLVNRAGRVAYVLASLVVGAIVYVLTVLLFSVLVRHTLGDANTLAQTFLNWEFILVGLVAREVMLWTGLAIGSRGIRVRRRNREARKHYEQEVADVRS
jgi:hypothetical protein